MLAVFTFAKVTYSLATLGWAALTYIAALSDPVVAGVFSLVNVLLNAVTIYVLHRLLSGVPAKVDTATAILEEQHSHMAKRSDDTPPEGVPE